MLVPLKIAHRPRGWAERMPTPGVATSGLNQSETGVGPAEEKSPITSGGPLPEVVTAEAVVAFGAFPGEEIVPRPNSPKAFPAEIAGTTPASAARPTPRT